MSIVKKYHQRPAQELYDLQNDPLEQNNLAANPAYKSIVAKMDKDLQWMKVQGDKEKVYNTPVLTIPELEDK